MKDYLDIEVIGGRKKKRTTKKRRRRTTTRRTTRRRRTKKPDIMEIAKTGALTGLGVILADQILGQISNVATGSPDPKVAALGVGAGAAALGTMRMKASTKKIVDPIILGAIAGAVYSLYQIFQLEGSAPSMSGIRGTYDEWNRKLTGGITYALPVPAPDITETIV